jgi:hypothetical protein
MMKKFAQWFSYVSLAFVLSMAVWDGLSTNADAQSGGGYPSNPNFQSVKIKGNQVFSPQVVSLTTASTRTSNTTLTLDTTLQESLAAGTYKIEFIGLVQGGTTGGMQATVYATNANLTYSAYAQCTMTVYAYQLTATVGWISDALVTSTPTTGTDCYIGTSYFPVNPALLTLNTVIVLNATTTVGVIWAQQTSSATASGWGQGSTFTATRLQ